MWVNGLIKAKNLFQEDTIFVKIEPTEYSRVLTFYRAYRKDTELATGVLTEAAIKPESLSVLCVNLPKIIGISVVDHSNRELIHVIIEGFFIKKTNITSAVSQTMMYLTNNIVQNEANQQDLDVKLLREYVQLSIENVEIENQLDLAPFRILLSQQYDSKG